MARVLASAQRLGLRNALRYHLHCRLRVQVAVKVQRPRVLASVGLDLYVMRQVAAAIQRLPSVRRLGWKHHRRLDSTATGGLTLDNTNPGTDMHA